MEEVEVVLGELHLFDLEMGMEVLVVELNQSILILGQELEVLVEVEVEGLNLE